MDLEVVAALRAAGIDPTLASELPVVAVQLDSAGRPTAVGDEVVVYAGEKPATVRLKRIPELWTGTTRPPELGDRPPEAYLLFFALIEATVIDYCVAAGQAETDAELERLYRHLRRRPDGRDPKPIFSYMQAGARLYLSLRDASQAEFEAVAQRLAVSARHFTTGPSSTNYVQVVGDQFAGRL